MKTLSRWPQVSLRLAYLVFGLVPPLLAQQPLSSSTVPPAPGAGLFLSNCAGCHGSDGGGGEHAPNIATTAQVRQLRDQDLVIILQKGIPANGMPPFAWLHPQEIAFLVSYLRELQGRGKAVKLTGDPGQGAQLFYGKAQCSNCHMINGKGGFFGGDLSLYGANASVEEIQGVILEPEKNLPAKKKATTLVTRQGGEFTGMVKVDDNFVISLQTMDGTFHSFRKEELVKMDVGSHSLMPTDYATRLSSKDLNDLTSFLVQSAIDLTKTSVVSLTKKDDDEE